MPRNVRNFWIELDVDGSKSRVETGPQAASGGFSLTVKMRQKGDIIRALVVTGVAHDDGRLSLIVDECGQDHVDDTRVQVDTMR